MARKREQISIPVDRELREVLEREAAREHRTLSGQVRHLLCEAVQRTEQEGQAA
jgi:hypothetical protein